MESFHTKKTVYRHQGMHRVYWAIGVIFVILIFYFNIFSIEYTQYRLIPTQHIWSVLGVILAFIGISFAMYARHFLKGNWSSMVTLKEKHELIQSGPYAIVRHPIYSGMLLALLGTAIIIGELSAFITLIICLIVLIYKLRLEEQVLRRHFGEKYDIYMRRVKALIPFLV